MVTFLTRKVIHQILLTAISMTIALQVEATQEVLSPADGAGTSETVSINWTSSDTDNSSISACLVTPTCAPNVGSIITKQTNACRCFSANNNEPPTTTVQTAEIRYADLVSPGTAPPSSIRWSVVQTLLVNASLDKHKVISSLGSGRSYRMTSPSSLALIKYDENMSLAWNVNVPNADSFLVDVCCSADRSHTSQLVHDGNVNIHLPDVLRAGCNSPARGVKATVKACRNGGCGEASKLDVCSSEFLTISRAAGQGPRDFAFAWKSVANADSYMLDICCDANKLTKSRLIQTNTPTVDNQLKLRETGDPYLLNVEESFNTVSCRVGSDGLIRGAGFKASIRPCTNGVCGESISNTHCEPLLTTPTHPPF